MKYVKRTKKQIVHTTKTKDILNMSKAKVMNERSAVQQNSDIESK